MRTEPLAAINSFALAIGHFATLDDMLVYALDKVLEVVEREAGGVYLLDEERGELKLVVHRGLPEVVWKNFDNMKVGEGLSGRVVLEGSPIVIRNLADDPRLTRMSARAEGYRAFASVPLRAGRKIYGALNVHSRVDRAFTEEDLQLLTSMAAQIGLAVANTRLYLSLRASERKFRGLVENAEDLIYLTDREGRLTYVNPTVQSLLGYEPDELSGRPGWIVSLAHPDDRHRMSEALPRMLAGEVMHSFEFRLRHANGTFRWFCQTNVPLRDESGDVIGMQSIAHDVTALREMQAQVAHAQRLADLGRMAATVAHEIRNPLGAIVNSISILRRPAADAAPKLHDIITQEAHRLDGIIRDFLLFARPPARSPADCDIRQLVDAGVELFRCDAKVAGHVDVHVSSSPRLPTILADANQLRQVVWNLLTNAAEAMPHGGRIDVELRELPDERGVVLQVVDEGVGVFEPTRVFEPFYTTKSQGTGLGLAVVARIVRDHGGTIEAGNSAGRGACFTVRLPLAAPGVSRTPAS